VRKLALVVLTGFLIPGLAHALGLGEIKVDSALNQPLKAEITVLSANPDEVIDIVAKLADQEAFDRLGLERPYGLTKLQFKPAVREGVPVIVVTTRQPVKEPFLDFLLDLRWPKGRLLREYTILLDPPVLMESRAVATQAPEVAATEPQVETVVAPAPVVSVEPEAAPEPVAEPSPEPAPEPVAVSEPAPEPEQVAVAEPEPAPAAEPVAVTPAAEPMIRPDTGVSEESEVAEAPLFPLIPIGVDDAASFYGEAPTDDYKVQANDTLWEIANANRPDDVSVNQMMMAMLRANPEAFHQNNINNLKQGVILRMPTREEMDAVEIATANAEVKEQYALWREYREQVAGTAIPQDAVPAAPEETVAESASEEVAESAETEVATAPEGELQILAPESETASGETVMAGGDDLSTLQNDLSLAKESLESARQKNTDLESRVLQLEQMLQKQERLLNLKDEQISDLQSQMQEAPEAVVPVEEADEEAPAEEPQTEAVEEEPAAVEVVEESATEAPMTEEMAVTEEVAATEEVVEEIVAEAAPAEEQPAEEIAVVEEEVQEVVSEPEPAEQKVAKAPEPEQAAPSFLDDLLADPKMLGIAGGGILLVIALIVSLVRRMGKTKEVAPAPTEPEPDFSAVEGAGEEVPEIEETQVMEQPVFEEETPAEEPAAEQEFSGESTQVMDLSEDEPVAEEALAGSGEVAEEADDTLSEADVYLAYGLHDQCEDLLTKALEERPERNDYRAKLLENYFAAKEKDKFESMAQELHGKLGDTSDKMWVRTVVMGKELAPDNDLFSGDVADVSLDDIVSEKPEADEFDLSIDLGAGDESPDLEIGSVDMEESIDIAEAEPTEELDVTAEVIQSADEGLEFDVGDIDLGGLDLGEGDDELLTIDEASETETLDLTDDLMEEPGSDSGTLTMDQPPSIPEEDLGADVTLETDIPVSFDIEEGDEVVDETSDTGTLDVGELDVTEDDLDVGAEGLDLDVDFGETEETVDLSADTDIDFGLDEDLGLDEEVGLPDSEDEVGTKLDLAKAYIDMGDNDGARSTLEEVMNEGNDDQKKEAQELMGQIS
jgi:pilus assembly protein FimV